MEPKWIWIELMSLCCYIKVVAGEPSKSPPLGKVTPEDQHPSLHDDCVWSPSVHSESNLQTLHEDEDLRNNDRFPKEFGSCLGK